MRAKTLTLKRSRDLRRRLSPPEARLWNLLRERIEGEPAFRRQHGEEPYILDFYCAKARLAVEVDGELHAYDDRPAYDARRDAYLRGQGIHVLRVPAKAVMNDVGTVADYVRQLARDLASNPALIVEQRTWL